MSTRASSATRRNRRSSPALPGDAVAGRRGAHRTGVVLAFDVDGLVDLARRADGVIEFVPQVGDFVANGDPLFRCIGGDGASMTTLRHSVAIGPERTMEQDPAFAFRIIVDIAAKALSPAINDPTTAVLALDQVHRLLRTVGRRQLDTGLVHDDDGPPAARLSHAGLGRLRQPGGHRDPAVRRQQHPDRPAHPGDAGKPDRGGAAAAGHPAARGTRSAQARGRTRFPGSRGSHARHLRRFPGRGRITVIAAGGVGSISARSIGRPPPCGSSRRSGRGLISWRSAAVRLSCLARCASAVRRGGVRRRRRRSQRLDARGAQRPDPPELP